MKKRNELLAALTLAVTTLGIASVSDAAVISIGVNNTIMHTPLTNAAAGFRYQQVYNGGAFGSITPQQPIWITSISFLAPSQQCFPSSGAPICFPVANDGSIATGDYSVNLSTTSRTAQSGSTGGLSSNLDSNVGSDVVSFFSGEVSNTLTFTAQTPFLYDPTVGSLLMDIRVNSQQANNAYFAASAILNDAMSSATLSGTANFALVTRFEYQFEPPVSQQVPVPASIVLLGGGLMALAGATLRRRREQDI